MKRRRREELQKLTQPGLVFCFGTSRRKLIAEELENVYHKHLVRLYALTSIEATAEKVSRAIGRNIEENKFAALVSFANSMDWSRFTSTTLFDNVRKKRYVVGKHFMQYTTCAGEWRPELEWQRSQEAMLWDKGFYATEGSREEYELPKPITIEGGEEVEDAGIA